MKTKKTPEFPLVITRGSVSVKIYRTPSHGSEGYTVSYWLAGQRQRHAYALLQEARDKAAQVAAKLTSGDLDVLTLRSADKAAYTRAIQTIAPTGVSIETAAAQFADVWKILSGASLIEAAKEYAKRHHAVVAAKTVSEVADEFLAERIADSVSQRYSQQLEFKLKRIKTAFAGPINSVESTHIQDFLRNLAIKPRTKGKATRLVKPKTKNDYRQLLGQFFAYAKLKRYVAKDHDCMEGIGKFKKALVAIQIYSADQIQALLAAAPDPLLPFIALGAFAGLRHSEIGKLDWSEINFENSFIVVTAAKAKTASRRIVPLLPNLAAWLLPLAKNSGRVCERDDMTRPEWRLDKAGR